MSISLEDLVAQVAAQQAKLSGGAAAIGSAYGNLQDLETQRQESLQREGEALQTTTRTQETGALNAQENMRRAASSFGTNMDDPSEIITQLAAEMNSSLKEATIATAKIAEKRSVGFFEDPIQNIINRVTVGADIADYNSAALRFNVAEKGLASIQAATQTNNKTQTEIAKTRTVASVDAVVQGVAEKANQAAINSKQQALLYNVQGVEKVANMNQQTLSNSFQLYNAEEAAKSRELQRASLALALEEREERIAAKKETAEEDAADAARVNAGLKFLLQGQANTLDPARVKKLLGAKNQLIQTAWEIGFQQEVRPDQRPMLSANAGQASLLIAGTNASLSPEMKSVKNLLEFSLGEASSGKVGGQLDPNVNPKDLNSLRDAATKNAMGQAVGMSRQIKPNDNSNIYIAPNVETVSSVRAVKESPLYRQVLAPQQTAGMKETDPDQIVSTSIAAVSSGKLRLEDAAQGIVNYFQAAVSMNNQMKQYDSVGLPIQSNYNAVIKLRGGRSIVVDLTDQARVANLISQQLAASRLADDPIGRAAFETFTIR